MVYKYYCKLSLTCKSPCKWSEHQSENAGIEEIFSHIIWTRWPPLISIAILYKFGCKTPKSWLFSTVKLKEFSNFAVNSKVEVTTPKLQVELATFVSWRCHSLQMAPLLAVNIATVKLPKVLSLYFCLARSNCTNCYGGYFLLPCCLTGWRLTPK